MIRDYLQDALKLLKPDTPDWYGWAKVIVTGKRKLEI